jgi:peptidyl-prolyl cis-trans isomerase D
VTDAEIMDYMKKTKRNLKQMKLEVEYVLIEDKASAEDESEAKSK